MQKNDIRKTPPQWCKNAVPSARGWCDPKTGELLISVKGIKFEVAAPVTEVKIEAKDVKVEIETPPVEENVEEAPKTEKVAVEQPKKRTTRKKKTTTEK